MLTHVSIGPMSDGSYAVGYRTPGCTSHTLVSAGMTAARAADEADRINQEQEQQAIQIQRDQEHRNRVLGLKPVVDYLPDWTPDTPAAFAARMAIADAKQGNRDAAGTE